VTVYVVLGAYAYEGFDDVYECEGFDEPAAVFSSREVAEEFAARGKGCGKWYDEIEIFEMIVDQVPKDWGK
jgi:hypothetical protein